MALDQTTEMLAHFIGQFEIATEAVRLKEAYAAFRAMRDEAPDLGDLLTVSIRFTSSYALDGFMPGLGFFSPFTPLPAASLLPVVNTTTGAGFQPSGVFYAPPSTPPALDVVVPPPIAFGAMGPAGSVITVTYQLNVLDDGDVIFVPGAAPLEMMIRDTELVQDAVVVAKAMTAFNTPEPLSQDGSALGYGMAVLGDIKSSKAPDLEGVTATLSREASPGVVIDGAKADAMVTTADVLPEFFLSDEEETEAPEEAESGSLPEGASFTLSDTPEPELDAPESPWEVGDGHKITSGANQLVNEAAVFTSWLDAPVIAVMKDVVSVDAISQVNVLVEFDVDETDKIPGMDKEPGSTALNTASLNASSVPFQVEGGGGVPSNWVVAKVEGDLMVVNWIEQHNFMLDNENVQIELSSQTSSFVLGENKAVNVTTLSEIGYGYDLIIIGGNMIDINMISQSNVLIDNDIVTFGDVPPDAVISSDNLAFNSATISSNGVDSYTDLDGALEQAGQDLGAGADMLPGKLMHEAAFNGLDVVRVLHIDGDYVAINAITQTNVLGDSDQVALALDKFEAEPGADVVVTTGSNTTMNLATLVNFGVDSSIHVGGDVYSDALLYQAELIDTSADPLGVGISDLANEAVAFLADGLIEDVPSIEDSVMIDPVLDGGGTAPDVLTTMLA